MLIATWNVNGIRARIERLLAFLDRHQPDVVAIQETKTVDATFPSEILAEKGWHAAWFGQKSYNGVAILAREPPRDVVPGMLGEPADAERRVLTATVGGVRIVNVYVPNGRHVEDPAFQAKLAWLERLRAHLDATADPQQPLVMLGDFNIAPDERDVYDPVAWAGQVHFHPREHAALARLVDWGLHDLFRLHHAEGGRYTWWDYRQLAFPKNAGLRIDLLLGTASVRDRCSTCEIDRAERKGAKPSDHAPVLASLR